MQKVSVEIHIPDLGTEGRIVKGIDVAMLVDMWSR